MAYTYDIGTDRGKVRLRLGDAYGEPDDPSTYTFEDDEIDALLTAGGTVDGATAEGLKVLLVDKARRAKAFNLKGLSVNDSAGLATLRELLAVYGGLPTVGVVLPALLPSDQGFNESDP